MTDGQLKLIAKFFTWRRYKSDPDIEGLKRLDVKYKTEYDKQKQHGHDIASLRANEIIIHEILLQ